MNWISVRDKLPDSDTCVLVACPQANEPVWIGYFDDDEPAPLWRLAEGAMIDYPVTHWMPLPELPQARKAKA